MSLHGEIRFGTRLSVIGIQMIVGFDGTVLKGSQTGIGYYTRLLIQHLQAERHGPEVLAYNGFGMKEHTGRQDPHPSGESSFVHDAARQLAHHLKKAGPARKIWRSAKAMGFRNAARSVDLFHATNYLPPVEISAPTLHLIHDVSHIRYPEWHPRERVHWLEKRSREFLRAPLVNTVSQFSAREIEATLGIGADRIRITYPGINPSYTGPARDERAPLQALGVDPGRFFLCVGTLEPRKNLATAIHAYGDLSPSQQEKFPLLVAGPPGWGNLELPETAVALERRGLLRFLGYVDEPLMRALYQECTAFLFPSSYEGFGMPVSEAMALGSRPLIAKGGAPEEVAGELGIALPAFDPEAWRLAMSQAAEEDWHQDDDLRERLRERSRKFSWSANARATMEIYTALIREDF